MMTTLTCPMQWCALVLQKRETTKYTTEARTQQYATAFFHFAVLIITLSCTKIINSLYNVDQFIIVQFGLHMYRCMLSPDGQHLDTILQIHVSILNSHWHFYFVHPPYIIFFSTQKNQ